MATIKDIAKEANVPVSTVSYVLNRKGKPIKEKHKEIVEIAKRLNYVPNQKARSLVSGRANNIGMIISHHPGTTFAEPFFAEMLFRISNRLSKENMGITLYSWYDMDLESLYQYILNGSTDGIIWYQGEVPGPIKEITKSRNIPLVLLIDKDEDINYLAIDDYTGQRKALEYLYENNHREILFISSMDVSIRERAYLDFVASHKLDYHTVIRSDHTELQTYNMLDQYLAENGKDFTAIAAETDVMAIGALQVMKKWGIRVPEEVSIIGYDDIPLASCCNPPLTTIHQSIVEMVDDAINCIFDMLDHGKEELVQKVYVHDLIIRESTKEMKRSE